MKTFKKAFALILTLALVMSLGITAFAKDSTPTTPAQGIKVVNPSKDISIAGTTVTAYKLFDLSYDSSKGASGAYTYTPVAGLKDYKFTSTVDTDFGEVTQDKIYDFLMANKASQAALQEFAHDVQKKVAAGTLTLAAISQKVPDGKQEVTIPVEADNLGYFLITVTPTVVDGSSNTALAPAVSVSLDSTDLLPTVYVKADAPQVEKDVKLAGDTSFKDQAVTAEIGSTVTFRITTHVPNYYGYQAYVFEIQDTYSKGIQPDADSISIKITREGAGSTETDVAAFDKTTKTDHYTYATKKAASTSTTVLKFAKADEDFLTWVNDYNSADDVTKILPGDKITITYDATVTEEALKTNAESNAALIRYSNNPTTVDGNDPVGPGETPKPKETPESKTYVYDFSLDVLKKDGTEGENKNNALAGAVFALKNKKDTGKGYYKYTVKDNDVDTVTWVNNVDTATVFITNADGKLVPAVKSNGKWIASTVDTNVNTFKGLKAGTYYLEELAAPTGYTKLPGFQQVEIKPVTNDGKDPSKIQYIFTQLGDGTEAAVTSEVAVNHTAAAGTQIVFAREIMNLAGTKLPSTGGIGTTIFYTVGGILMVTALVLLITKKKMSVK